MGDPIARLDPLGLASSLHHPKAVALQMALALEAQGLTSAQVAIHLAGAGISAVLIAEILDNQSNGQKK